MGDLAINPGTSPVVLKNLQLQTFGVDYHTWGDSQFVFDAVDDYNYKSINITNGGIDGMTMVNGVSSGVSGTTTLANLPDDSDVWIRVISNGTSVMVLAATSQSGLDTASVCFTSDSFGVTGGSLGFTAPTTGIDDILSVTIVSGSATEAAESFSGSSDTLAYDANGNLTYDGTQSYAYDAWNRLKTTAHAYRDSSGTLHSGQVSGTYSYDAAGRRIVKAVSGTGSMDCTYHDYYAGQSNIEERNGSNQSIKDRVWSLEYIDDAVQTRVNTNPTGTASWSSYWLCQDANYNVLGVVNASGTLTERYEYSAYGQRQVFASSGSNDPGCYTPTSMSGRVIATGSVVEPWGINEVGHQGLVHDEENGLVYNRARMLNPTLGRFMQEDPWQQKPGTPSPGDSYPDGMNFYQYVGSEPIDFVDETGLLFGAPIDKHKHDHGRHRSHDTLFGGYSYEEHRPIVCVR